MFTLKEVNTSKVETAPYHDWRNVVILFFVGLVSLIGFNSHMFLEINRGSFFATTPRSEEFAKFNSDGLMRVLNNLLAKESTFEKLKTERVPVIDPSL